MKAVISLIAIVCLVGASASAEPATRPGRAAPVGTAMLDRLREQMATHLDLSPEQKAKVDAILTKAREEFQGMRTELERMEPRERMQQVGDFFRDVRNDLAKVLNDQQRALFEKKLDEARARRQGLGNATLAQRPAERRAAPPASTQSAMMDDNMMNEMGGSASKQRKKPSDPAQQKTAATVVLPPGTPAPQFDLRKLDGSLVQLSSLKGRVVVLVFGSYSCPAFRQRVATLEKLKTEYGTRAQFFVVYVKEAHALGEWEVDRNKADGIAVEQPRSADARRTLAQQARESLKLTVPILLDSMGNDTAISYGASANSVYVIDRDGTILASQEWFDATGIRRAIEQAVSSARPATRPAA